MWSILLTSYMITRKVLPHVARGQIAQLVEQGTENPRARGSSPFLATR